MRSLSLRTIVSALLACGALNGAPNRMVWAWERPEDLRFLNPDRTGVAFLSATVRLDHALVRIEPRRQAVYVPPHTYMMAVVRIETSEPALSEAQLKATAAELLRSAHRAGVSALQIDFDARTSERDFYRKLIEHIRPQVKQLSITALTSWCLDDPWIATLPVDEAVPMLFRMGPDDVAVRRQLANGRRFAVKACSTSAGISNDEVLPAVPPIQRLYIFSAVRWTRAGYDALSWHIRSLP